MIRGLLLLFTAAGLTQAANTAAWELNNYQDFSKGKFSGLSLSRDGRMTLAPAMQTLFASEQPYVWSVAQSSNGSVYFGTGHRGRVFAVDPAGKGSVLWTSSQPEVFAVTVAQDGTVYAGSSPDGKVYRIKDGKVAEFFTPKAHYIWALHVGADGSVFVGTGDPGRVYRVSPNGQGEVYFDSGQMHITCLNTDGRGALLAGSEPNGLLYRISAKDKAFVLYDSNLPEIRSISVAPDGTIYAAALGGSISQKTTAATSGGTSVTSTTTVTAPATTITVTDEAASQNAAEIKPPKTEASKQQNTVQAVTAPTPQVVEMMGVEKSAVYRINPDNTVETLWTSKDENAYDLLVWGKELLFGTDQQGRIYRLGADRRLTLLAQTNEGETTRLLPSPDRKLLVATGTMGKLVRLSDTPGASGVYESPVQDASTVARWGHLSWRAQNVPGTKLSFRTRSGNSARPDSTWSDWSEPLSDARGSKIASPNARFIQFKGEFTGSNGNSPALTGVTLAYLPQNTPPVVKSINVTTQLGAAPATSRVTAPASTPSTATYSVTVTDTGDATASAATGTPTQMLSRGVSQQILVSWQAEDPDGDRLLYSVYFRGEEETAWKLLRGNFAETSILFDGDVFADGKYLFRVVASDKLSNPGGSAREAELVSAPVLFDNTPPVVKAGAARRIGNRVEIDIEAADAAGTLRRAEYSVDANTWVPLEALDGVIDGPEEKFLLRLENLAPGEHLIVIRVYDSSNNAGLTKVLVQ